MLPSVDVSKDTRMNLIFFNLKNCSSSNIKNLQIGYLVPRFVLNHNLKMYFYSLNHFLWLSGLNHGLTLKFLSGHSNTISIMDLYFSTLFYEQHCLLFQISNFAALNHCLFTVSLVKPFDWFLMQSFFKLRVFSFCIYFTGPFCGISLFSSTHKIFHCREYLKSFHLSKYWNIEDSMFVVFIQEAEDFGI